LVEARVVDAGVCGTLDQSKDEGQYQAVIRAAYALLAVGDAEAAKELLAAFSRRGVDSLC
jgi:hypothetical protein